MLAIWEGTGLVLQRQMVLSYLGDYDNDDCFIFHFIFGATFYWVSDGIKDETLPSLTFVSVC